MVLENNNITPKQIQSKSIDINAMTYSKMLTEWVYQYWTMSCAETRWGWSSSKGVPFERNTERVKYPHFHNWCLCYCQSPWPARKQNHCVCRHWPPQLHPSLCHPWPLQHCLSYHIPRYTTQYAHSARPDRWLRAAQVLCHAMVSNWFSHTFQ